MSVVHASGKKKKKNKVVVAAGVVNVLATFNNTIVTITDMQGNVVAWSSAGQSGFKGSRKSTAYAAQVCSTNAAKIASTEYGMKTVTVKVRGLGAGREAAIRAAHTYFDILAIKYRVKMPNNGVRPPKRRRV